MSRPAYRAPRPASDLDVRASAESGRSSVEELFRDVTDLESSDWMRIVLPDIVPPESFFARHSAGEDEQEGGGPDCAPPRSSWATEVVRQAWDRFVGILVSHPAAGPARLRELLAFAEAEERTLRSLRHEKGRSLDDARVPFAHEGLGDDEHEEIEMGRLAEVASLERQRRDLLKQAEVVSFYSSVIRNVLWRSIAFGDEREWMSIPEGEREGMVLASTSQTVLSGIKQAEIIIRAFDYKSSHGNKPEDKGDIFSDLDSMPFMKGHPASIDTAFKAVQRAFAVQGDKWPKAGGGRPRPVLLEDRIEAMRAFVSRHG